ncbi:MAG: hypothetical protein ABIS92_15450 [Polyangia bacterium]
MSRRVVSSALVCLLALLCVHGRSSSAFASPASDGQLAGNLDAQFLFPRTLPSNGRLRDAGDTAGGHRALSLPVGVLRQPGSLVAGAPDVCRATLPFAFPLALHAVSVSARTSRGPPSPVV